MDKDHTLTPPIPPYDEPDSSDTSVNTPPTNSPLYGGLGKGKADAGRGSKKLAIRRLDANEFQEFRKVEAEGGRVGSAPIGSWSKMAIMRVSRRTSKTRTCSCLGLTYALNIFRSPETSVIADLETASLDDIVPVRAYGPYRSEYGRLGEFPHLPPLLIIATGAGAALVLDFIGSMRANKTTPLQPVSVCYSTNSLALLQFVTNTLLAERTVGVHIQTALTRHDELEVFDTSSNPKGEFVLGRLDVKKIVAEASLDTEVYFCGGGAINALLRETCAQRGMKYVGSSVQ